MGALRNPFFSYVEERQMNDLPTFDVHEPPYALLSLQEPVDSRTCAREG
jgi:hypothetical protein